MKKLLVLIVALGQKTKENLFMPINRITRTAMKYQAKKFAYPEVWGYIRRNQTASSFECNHCGQSFQTNEQLRRHEIDRIHHR